MALEPNKRKTRRQAADPVSAVIALRVLGNWIEAEPLRVQLIAAAAAGTEIELDFEGLDRLDVTAFQVLLAASRTVWGQSGKLWFTHHEGGVKAGFIQAGAQELLHLHAKVEAR